MEFKILVEDLQSIISKLSVVSKPNTNEIVSMVVIDVGEDVKFKSTNGSTHLIITSNECEIIKRGSVCIKLEEIKGYISKFVPLMGDFGTKDFHFIVEGNKCVIKTKTLFQSNRPSYRTLKVNCFKVDYPQIKPFGEAQVILNSSILKRGIDKVMHCINPAEVRRSITGVNVTITNNGIVFTGTNGVKLAEFEFDINADVENSSYIFTYNFASVLRSVLEEDSQVFIRFEGRYVYLKSNDVYMIGSLIVSDSYPDYKPMLDLENLITLPRLDFVDTVHTVLDVLDQEDNDRLMIEFEGNKLTIANDKFEAFQEFENTFEHNFAFDINGEYLDSILKDFSSDHIELYFKEGVKYIVFKDPNSRKHAALITTLKRR